MYLFAAWKLSRLETSSPIVLMFIDGTALVHGCFWHRHAGCPYATTPSTRQEFWRAKFDANTERDRRNRHDLLQAGWRVATVWECALRKQAAVEVAEQLERWLRESSPVFNTSLFSGHEPSG